MCYSLLHHHMEKETLFKRDMYQKDIERTSLSKLTKLISWYNFSKSFSDASNSSDIEEKVMRQVNMLKQFDMEPLRLFLRNLLYWKKKIALKKNLI